MNTITILLIIIGVVFFVASFFVSEKLGSKELEKISNYTEEEIKVIMNTEISDAKSKVTDIIEEQVDLSVDSVNSKLAKITDDKILAINDYYETVKKETESSHKEVTFLYNMLNEKHEEVLKTSIELTSKISELNRMIESLENMTQLKKESFEAEITNTDENIELSDNEGDSIRGSIEEPGEIKDLVLSKLQEGIAPVDIARDLEIGFGEVKLYYDLYQKSLQEKVEDEA